MATESIFVPIKIETDEEIANFVNALEQVEADPYVIPDSSNLFHEASEEEMDNIVAVLGRV